MSGLTNSQLEQLAKKSLGKLFLGVYPCDAKPKINKDKFNISVIFNLSKHYEKGSHYVAVLFRKKDILYFDSYGKSLTNKYIKNYLKTFNKPVMYQTIKIQHKNSIFCGFYCLAYLKAVQKYNLPVLKFLKMFEYPATTKNDTIVTNFLTNKKT